MRYSLLRALLFKLDPERAHHLTLSLLNRLPKQFFPAVDSKPVQVLGMNFPHPLGLAAGLDKNGEYLDGLAKLGFAFIELGTVTPKPQTGNPTPRLFRLVQAHALINRMGFNNQGVDALVANVQRSYYRGILGINIGKNKDTPLHQAAEDYLHCLNKVYPYASYIAVNISSPNTPDLRQLQHSEFFDNLLQQLGDAQKKCADKHQRFVPLLVKISPDEADDNLKRMAESALKHQISGMIATNTTCSRPGVTALAHAKETGGLSGRPLAPMALHGLRVLKKEVGDALSLIGVGGIDSPQAAKERLEAGADLVQLYTGMIYEGPGLIHRIVRGL